jgi:hypothetical protein
MEVNLIFFEFERLPQFFMKKEDDLNYFFKMEWSQFFMKKEDDLNFF